MLKKIWQFLLSAFKNGINVNVNINVFNGDIIINEHAESVQKKAEEDG